MVGSDARTARAEIALMRRAVNFMADEAETRLVLFGTPEYL